MKQELRITTAYRFATGLAQLALARVAPHWLLSLLLQKASVAPA